MSDGDNESFVSENELQAFVTSTLMAIMKGIEDAQPVARIASAHGTGEYGFSAPDNVNFDVAVTAKRSGTTKGGFKVQVFSVGANAGAEAGSEHSSVSRVQFVVPTKFKSNRRD